MHPSTQVQAGISRLKRAQAGADAFLMARKFRSSDLMQERFFCFSFCVHHFISTNAGKLFCLFSPHRLAPQRRSERDLISTLQSRSCHVGAAWTRAITAPPAPVTWYAWMAMQCVRRHENVGRSGGGEAGGTGSRQCVKGKSYKYSMRERLGLLLFLSPTIVETSETSHINSRHGFLPWAILPLQLRGPVQCRECG